MSLRPWTPPTEGGAGGELTQLFGSVLGDTRRVCRREYAREVEGWCRKREREMVIEVCCVCVCVLVDIRVSLLSVCAVCVISAPSAVFIRCLQCDASLQLLGAVQRRVAQRSAVQSCRACAVVGECRSLRAWLCAFVLDY